jgi:hypothetical protein
MTITDNEPTEGDAHEQLWSVQDECGRLRDYSDVLVPMLARMYKRRLVGYSALGCVVSDGKPD